MGRPKFRAEIPVELVRVEDGGTSNDRTQDQRLGSVAVAVAVADDRVEFVVSVTLRFY